MAKTSISSCSNPPPRRSIQEATLSGVANLIRLLPTGTVFLFQFLNPVVTNNGHCAALIKYLSGTLLAVCSLFCFFSTFTDSYTDRDGNTHYGIATLKGFWPPPDSTGAAPSVDLSSYRLRVGDFVHAFFSVIVFAVVSLLDSDTVECFYPGFESTGKVLLMALPPAIGAVSSSVFVAFPNKRHGIGYPASQPSNSEDERTQ